MTTYLDSYMRELRDKSKLRKMFKSMGWKENDTEFVLGDKLYRKGEVVTAGHSQTAKGFLEYFRPSGEISQWLDATSVLGLAGWEAHAFLLCTGFIPPLLKLDNRQGFTVSAVGETGTGKSTMGRFIASIYGHPDQTWVARDSTINALYERIGAYYSLPVYMDEITTIDPKDLRNLIYRIATGKARDRLKQDASVREGAQWSTLLIVSTNDPLQSKLQLEKSNPEAEAMRLFEVEVVTPPGFYDVAADVHALLSSNYGLVGPEYIRFIVDHLDEVRAGVKDAMERGAIEFKMHGKERFWTQAVALAIYGGGLAYKAGLLAFDPQELKPWLKAETHRMREEVKDAASTPIEIIGEYLNEHMNERLVVSGANVALGVNKLPSRGLSQRYERDNHLLYVGRRHLKTWMDRHHHNYNEVKKELYKKQVLLNHDARKVLGAGTDLTGEQVPCWKFATNHPEMGVVLNETK